MEKLNDLEQQIYKRQMMIQEWGEEKQLLLKKKTVLVVGAGGLGSPVSINLAMAGVGEIRICDYDDVEYSNLNRQFLHNVDRVGMNKALSAKKTLNSYNPNIKVTAFAKKLTIDNIDEIAGKADIIIDCLDNFETRYLINDYAVKKGIPVVYGSVWGFDGRLSFISYPETPCLRCIFPEAPKKEIFPIIGSTAMVIGALQAMEAIKYMTETGTNLKNKLLVWEGSRQSFKTFKISTVKTCNVCSSLREEVTAYGSIAAE